jgi:hypothetical protein
MLSIDRLAFAPVPLLSVYWLSHFELPRHLGVREGNTSVDCGAKSGGADIAEPWLPRIKSNTGAGFLEVRHHAG